MDGGHEIVQANVPRTEASAAAGGCLAQGISHLEISTASHLNYGVVFVVQNESSCIAHV